MNYTNLIDSCKAHLPVQFAMNMNSFARSDTGVVIDSEPHLSCTCKTCFFFSPLAVRVHTGCSPFPFYTPTKPFFKNKTVLIPQLIIIFYMLDDGNIM